MKKRINVFDVFILLCGIISFWLVISHIMHFNLANYIYEQKDLPDVLYGTNVVNKWADLSFFTYITILIFAFWCFFMFASKLFKIKNFYDFLTKDYTTTFVLTNYVCTVVIYNIFQIVAGDDFGLYNKASSLAWHNFGTNILCHYIMFILACIILLKVQSTITKSKLPYMFVTMFLVVYYLIVKICGEYAYKVKWYPYFIFDSGAFASAFNIHNQTISVILLIICCVAIYMFYMILFFLIKKHKNKQVLCLHSINKA